MISKNLTFQKTISLFLVISILMPSLVFFSFPKKGQAQWVVSDPITEVNTGITAGSTTTLTVKTIALEILKQMLMAVVRALLNRMTQSTIIWKTPILSLKI